MNEQNTAAWAALSIDECKALMDMAGVRWWVAGGVAIDVFLGFPSRTHEDLDVQILRRDEARLRNALTGWDIYDAGVNNFWCRPQSSSPWALEVMLLDTDGEDWVYRRCPSVRGSISSFGRVSPQGVPYVSPHIQLLFKAKLAHMQKNQQDYQLVWPALSRTEKVWLRNALRKEFPEGHIWLSP